MRKLLFTLVAMTLVLAACNSSSTEEQTDEQVDDAATEETTTDLEEVEEDEAEEEKTPDTPTENEEEQEATESTTADEKDENDTATTETNDTNSWKKPDAIDNMDHLEIVHLAYDILQAQDEKNYDFLEAAVAKGTTVDRSNDAFQFEIFDMDFFTKETLGDLEVRYTHEEDGIVIVGLGAINYDTESSLSIDFEFVQENGEWKMKTMDQNA